MDGLINKAKGALSGGSSSGQAPAQGQADGQKPDYVDKALSAGQKHFGMQQNAQMNERITDGARGLYEKQTGSKVDPKYSN